MKNILRSKVSFIIFAVVSAFIAMSLSVSANEFTVNDFNSLKNAVAAASNGDSIVITDNFALTQTLIIEKSLKFEAANKVELTVAGNFRHMGVRAVNGGNISLEFVNVELIGRKTSPDDTTAGGGIEIVRTFDIALSNRSNTINTLYLINPVIKNCYNSRGGGIAFTWPPGQPPIDFCNLDISGANAEISGNSAGDRGGGVSANHVTVNGGSISNNTAADRAGGVYAYGGLTMNGGAISNNTAVNYGGGSAQYYGDYIINGGTISNNQAALSGGGIYTPDYVEINGGTVEHNTTGGTGGGIYTAGGFAMKSGRIINNEAGADGGGVYADALFNPDFNFADVSTYVLDTVYTISGTISGNSAGRNGAGIYTNRTHYNAGEFGLLADLDFTSTLNISGAAMSGNAALQDGGSIYTVHGNSINAVNTTFSGNMAGQNGGTIWIGKLSDFTANDIIFRNNTAWEGYIWDTGSPGNEQQAADAAIHRANIIATTYTAPFTNAYNNYDVAYASGTPLSAYTPPAVTPPAATSPAATPTRRGRNNTEPEANTIITENERMLGNIAVPKKGLELDIAPEANPRMGRLSGFAVPATFLLCAACLIGIKKK